jgi:integrase
MFSKPMKDPEDWLQPEQVILLLDKVKQHNYRNYLLIKVALRTGRRIGELLKLKPEDIKMIGNRVEIYWNIEKKYRRIKRPDGTFITRNDKQGKKRYATETIAFRSNKPIDGSTYLELSKYIQDNNIPQNGYIFSNQSDWSKPITRQHVWRLVKRYAKDIGLPWIHPHTTRHTFAAIIAQNMKSPADLRKLQMLLEHSNIQITEGYLNFAQQEVSDLLEDSFKDEN